MDNYKVGRFLRHSVFSVCERIITNMFVCAIADVNEIDAVEIASVVKTVETVSNVNEVTFDWDVEDFQRKITQSPVGVDEKMISSKRIKTTVDNTKTIQVWLFQLVIRERCIRLRANIKRCRRYCLINVYIRTSDGQKLKAVEINNKFVDATTLESVNLVQCELLFAQPYRYTENNTLHITVKVQVLKPKGTTLGDQDENCIKEKMKKLYGDGNGEYSDLIVKSRSGDKIVQAHAAVLSSSSDAIQNTLVATQEDGNGKRTLVTEMSTETLEQAMRYIYIMEKSQIQQSQ